MDHQLIYFLIFLFCAVQFKNASSIMDFIWHKNEITTLVGVGHAITLILYGLGAIAMFVKLFAEIVLT